MKKNKKGAALVEYGMLVGLIAVLAIFSVQTLGGTTKDVFNTVSDTLSTQILSVSSDEEVVTDTTTEPLPPAPLLDSFVIPDHTLTGVSSVVSSGTPDGRLYASNELDQSLDGFLPPVLYSVDLTGQVFTDAYFVVTNETASNPASIYNYRGYVQPCFRFASDGRVKCGNPGSDWDHVAFNMTMDVDALGWRIRPEFNTSVAGSGGTTHGDPAQEWSVDLTWQVMQTSPTNSSLSRGNFTITRPIQ